MNYYSAYYKMFSKKLPKPVSITSLKSGMTVYHDDNGNLARFDCISGNPIKLKFTGLSIDSEPDSDYKMIYELEDLLGLSEEEILENESDGIFYFYDMPYYLDEVTSDVYPRKVSNWIK